MLNETLADARAKDAANESLRRDFEESRGREAALEEKLRRASLVRPNKENTSKLGATEKKAPLDSA